MPAKMQKVDRETKEYNALIMREQMESERITCYRGAAVGVFKSPGKCPYCDDKLLLRRKRECYEYVFCRGCLREFKRNVFDTKYKLEVVREYGT